MCSYRAVPIRSCFCDGARRLHIWAETDAASISEVRTFVGHLIPYDLWQGDRLIARVRP